jgi:hypothetical protein
MYIILIYRVCCNINRFSYLNLPKSFALAVFIFNLWMKDRFMGKVGSCPRSLHFWDTISLSRNVLFLICRVNDQCHIIVYVMQSHTTTLTHCYLKPSVFISKYSCTYFVSFFLPCSPFILCLIPYFHF